MNKTTYVLDASALLALLLGEPGAEHVVDALEHAEGFISAVNLAETYTKLTWAGFPLTQTVAAIEKLGLVVTPFTVDLAVRSAELALTTRTFGFSLGDRACLVTAEHLGAIALTADTQWKKWQTLSASPQIEFIRSR